MSLYPFEPWCDANLKVKAKYGDEALVWCFNVSHQDHNPSCYFNMSTSAWICFSCGFTGSLKHDPDAYSEKVQQDLIKQHINKLMNEDIEPEQKMVIPDSALARYKAKHMYWDRRNISKEMQDLFELGYDPISDAVTIPLRNLDGSLIGVTRRFIEPEHVGPRYKYPKGFKASQNLFASWLYEDYNMQTVCVTEGSIDAIRLWQQGYPAVALYGAMISATHVKTMLKMGVQKVIYFGDGDAAGNRAKQRAHGFWIRSDGTYKYKEETDLSHHFLMYHVPDHFGKKDAGEMSDGEIVSAVNLAEMYSPHISLKNNTTQKDSVGTRLSKLKGYN